MYYSTERFSIYHGDNREVLKQLPDNSIDSVVTDPPYELGFMGKKWDSTGIAYDVELWREVLRVLKPGGHLLAFSGSRTYHRMAVAIEDAGFDIRDQIMWIYGSGFPKSLDISKAIDKKPETRSTIDFKKWLGQQIDQCGKSRKQIDDECGFTACSYSKTDGKDNWSSNHPSAEKWAKMKEVIGLSDQWDWVITDNVEERGFIETTGGLHGGTGNTVGNYKTKLQGKQLSDNAISIDAKKWQGWGTALKPAHEPIVLARKPVTATVAVNVLEWGVGGLNIDGTRVGNEIISTHNAPTGTFAGGEPNRGSDTSSYQDHQGRWPANVIHDGSDEVVELFPANAGGGHWTKTKTTGFGEFGGGSSEYFGPGEKDGKGSAARFFYCAKASKRDRNEGLEEFEEKQTTGGGGLTEVGGAYGSIKAKAQNFHPTVKPTDLMAYLCRLVTPKGGTVLDPFMGSGSTGKAAMYEDFKFVGIEMTDEYLPIAKARIEFALSNQEKFLL
jgi:DNA modification methylase